MPRAFVLVTYDGDAEEAVDTISSIKDDISSATEIGAVVTSWSMCIGATDFVLTLYGLTIESIRRLAVLLRKELSKEMPPGSVGKTTLIGITEQEIIEPLTDIPTLAAPSGGVDDGSALRAGHLASLLAKEARSAWIPTIKRCMQTVCRINSSRSSKMPSDFLHMLSRANLGTDGVLVEDPPVQIDAFELRGDPVPEAKTLQLLAKRALSPSGGGIRVEDLAAATARALEVEIECIGSLSAKGWVVIDSDQDVVEISEAGLALAEEMHRVR